MSATVLEVEFRRGTEVLGRELITLEANDTLPNPLLPCGHPKRGAYRVRHGGEIVTICYSCRRWFHLEKDRPARSLLPKARVTRTADGFSTAYEDLSPDARAALELSRRAGGVAEASRAPEPSSPSDGARRQRRER